MNNASGHTFCPISLKCQEWLRVLRQLKLRSKKHPPVCIVERPGGFTGDILTRFPMYRPKYTTAGRRCVDGGLGFPDLCSPCLETIWAVRAFTKSDWVFLRHREISVARLAVMERLRSSTMDRFGLLCHGSFWNTGPLWDHLPPETPRKARGRSCSFMAIRHMRVGYSSGETQRKSSPEGAWNLVAGAGFEPAASGL